MKMHDGSWVEIEQGRQENQQQENRQQENQQIGQQPPIRESSEGIPASTR